tara:strand:- start:903 stop:1529 length:627 start_codon:yes stop_codon:yes gene_type:complete
MNQKHICFDLDGVIINSIEIMYKSWNEVKYKFNLNIEFETYREHIGKEFYSILDELDLPRNKWVEIKKVYDSTSSKHKNEILVYEYVLEFLKELNIKNFDISIYTSKTKKRTLEIIDLLLHEVDFKTVLTPEDLGKLSGKPSGDGLRKIIKLHELNSDDLLYIGDTYYDYLSAKDAEVKFKYATWGYGNKFLIDEEYWLDLDSLGSLL